MNFIYSKTKTDDVLKDIEELNTAIEKFEKQHNIFICNAFCIFVISGIFTIVNIVFHLNNIFLNITNLVAILASSLYIISSSSNPLFDDSIINKMYKIAMALSTSEDLQDGQKYQIVDDILNKEIIIALENNEAEIPGAYLKAYSIKKDEKSFKGNIIDFSYYDKKYEELKKKIEKILNKKHI